MSGRNSFIILIGIVVFLLGGMGMFNALYATGEQKEIMIDQWEISRVFDANRVNVENYPHFYIIFLSQWQKAPLDKNGYVDLNFACAQDKALPIQPLIFARASFYWPQKETLTLQPKIMGNPAIFFNNQKITLETEGTIKVTAEKGLNELFLMVGKMNNKKEWGFSCTTEHVLPAPTNDYKRLTKVWETGAVFVTPESALYDAKRDIIYVTSFDNQYNPYNTDEKLFTGFISRVKVTGEVENLKWIMNLNAPCGMCLYNNHLFTLERGCLTEIDIDAGKVINRYPVEGSEFLNDIAVDKEGAIYMTDTSSSAPKNSRIYKFQNGKTELWLGGNGIYRANGLFMLDQELLVGNSGDCYLKSVKLADKTVSGIICLGAGIIDGLRLDQNGNYLVSHWEGILYFITPEGNITRLLDTSKENLNTADFEYIKDKKLLIMPTFTGNKLIAYELH